MSPQPLFRYITSKELAELIKSGKEPCKDYVVIDVRDEDFAGGNIVNCLPSPSQTFEDALDSLLKDTKDVPKVIFHCALSQQRGPWAALRYARRRKADAEVTTGTDAAKAEPQKDKQEIFVLEGGFTKFQQDFKDDPQLVEKWDKEIWEEETWEEEEQDRDEEVWALDD
ncbi:hypothetical protein M407DRAFT_242702 [Tulasnella calospora MUT 4182]|uniref:Rhodanese domain-containing protein n=1 Tax=Tulasnella calospora MUT 4182 TaxID=1051891 RepID=A0A0C3QDV6_9AGAM|nr:hypothetical protein M407DRAFT_242702 [Tulasnella calospora MUT 4182]